MPQHVVLQVALGVEARAAILGANERLLPAVDAHVHHIVLADAEYFFATWVGAPERLSALVQVQMLVEPRLPRENLGAAFELALEFLVGFTTGILVFILFGSFPSAFGHGL